MPSLSDFISVLFNYFALLFVDPSIYIVMKSCQIIMMALLSYFMLGKIQLGYQIRGILLIIVGLALSGLATILS